MNASRRRTPVLVLVLLVAVVATVVVVVVTRRGGDDEGGGEGGGGRPGRDPAFATRAQIASLRVSGGAADRAKEIADGVKDGTLEGGGDAAETDIKDIDNRVGSIALTTALWWRRTGDDSYLKPLQRFILASPRYYRPGVESLAEMRAYGGLFAAVDVLQSSGEWDASSTLPNYRDVTWRQFMGGGGQLDKPLPQRTLSDVGRESWRTMRGLSRDTASNWGSVGRFAYLMWAVCQDDRKAVAEDVALVRRWLGDSGTEVPEFLTTSDYLSSWNNWGGTEDGGFGKIPAGLGRTDTKDPGLDGVVIEDVARGGTGYDPEAPHFGATDAGLTYPLENAGAVWATAGVLLNLGYDVGSWGEGGDALARMGTWFGREDADGGTVLGDAEDQFEIYRNHGWFAVRFGADLGSAQRRATTSGTDGLDRLTTYGDWLVADGSTWGRARKP